MKKQMQKILCLLLVLTVWMSLLSGVQAVRWDTGALAGGIYFVKGEKETAAGSCNTYQLTYQKGNQVAPRVIVGDTLYNSRMTPKEANAKAETEGKTLAALVNSDFFSMARGIPEGICIVNGELYCSDSWQNAVGVDYNNQVFLGKPSLSIQLTGGEKPLNVSYFNKTRTNAGLYLYNQRYDSETHFSREGVVVLLKLTGETLVRVGCQLPCEVVGITEGSESTPLEPGYLTLSVTADADAEKLAQVRALAVGDRLTLSIQTGNVQWYSAYQACGANVLLVENGKAMTKLGSSAAARTAIGVRKDGSAVVFCAEKAGSSAGMSLNALADTMQSLGCVTAMNLDGGGSTSMSVRYPGMADCTMENTSTDGSPRACEVYLGFAFTGKATGEAKNLHIYARDDYVLQGAYTTVQVTGTDAAGYPAAPKNVQLSCTGGRMAGYTFVAETQGTATVTAVSGELSAKTGVQVVSGPGTLTVTSGGKAVPSMTLQPEATASLQAVPKIGKSTVCIAGQSVRWIVAGDIGSIDSSGNFTAGSKSGVTGSILAVCGSTVTEVPVTIGNAAKTLLEFESASGLKAGTGAVIAAESTTAAFGKAAVSVKWSRESAETAQILTCTARIPAENTRVNFWVHGKAGTVLGLTFSGTTTTEQTLTGNGWNRLVIEVPEGCTYISAVTARGTEGQVILDNLTVTPGVTLPESCAVSVRNLRLSGGSLTAEVTETTGLGVSQLRLNVDGQPAAFSYDSESGKLSAALNLTSGAHRIVVSARDTAGHWTQAAAEVTGNTTSFADMGSHWAKNAVQVLYTGGIVAGSVKNDRLCYDPSRTTTRQELAVMIARYLGLEPAAYANTVLSFKDADQIDSWALPYVRAVVAEGIMQGGSSGFSPKASITRQEVMTVLGRTVDRGFVTGKTVSYADMARIADWALPYVGILSELGVVSGYPDGGVHPTASVTRAELAAMLYRLL